MQRPLARIALLVLGEPLRLNSGQNSSTREFVLHPIAQWARQLFVKLEQVDDQGLDVDSKLRLDECRAICNELLQFCSRESLPRPDLDRRELKLVAVDGDPGVQKLLKFALEQKGFQVTSVTDPETTMQVITEIQPDVVLLEIVLPRKSGFELLTEIQDRSDASSFRVVMGSGRAYDHHRLAALNGGTDDFVPKPYNMAELAAKLRHLVS